MIRLQLKLDPNRESLYEDALARLPGVELTDADGDALVTGDVAEAREIALPTLLDEPEACSSDELQGLAEDRLMPAHEWRFHPSIAPVHESNAAGQFGAPGLLRIHHWLSADVPTRQTAIAQVDLANWLFGAVPERSHFLENPNYLQLHLGYPGDGMALIDVATSRPGRDSYYSLHLIGSTGAAYADDHRNAHLLFAGEGSRALLHQSHSLLGIQAMLAEFVAGICEERAWRVSLADTMKALNIIAEVDHV